MAALVGCLNSLRGEFNQLNPTRDKTSDGWIGDAAHQASKSDHNPDPRGLVHAIDVDKDGVDMNKIVLHLADRCRAGLENRLQYMIWNRVIWSASWAWAARAYTGVNPHTQHAHFSAKSGTGWENDLRSWTVAQLGQIAPIVKPSAGTKPGSRTLRLATPLLRGEDVLYVQKWIGSKQAGAADGAYGPRCVEGVKWYQKVRGLRADGVVGPATWRQMGVVAK